MSDEAYCVKCETTIPDHQLNSQSMRVESCPHCGTVVRETKGVQGSNIAAQNASDIADIDAWLDERKHEKRADALGVETWTVETPFSGTCEVRYERRKPGRCSVSLTRRGAIPKNLEFVCACHGVQPCGSRSLTDSTATPTWGAFQIVGADSPLPELFDAIVKRLNEAVEANLRD